MAKTIFVNLPVADVARATAFYQALGFSQDQRFSNAAASAMVWSDAITFMLLARDFFQSFTPRPVADSHASTAHLLCLALDSREAVDAMTEAARGAGGAIDIRPAQDHAFMYGRSFADPDGHLFEPTWMDVAQFEAMQARETAA